MGCWPVPASGLLDAAGTGVKTHVSNYIQVEHIPSLLGVGYLLVPGPRQAWEATELYCWPLANRKTTAGGLRSGRSSGGGDDQLCFKDGSSERLGELFEATQLQRRAELGIRSHCLKVQLAEGLAKGRTGHEERRGSWRDPLFQKERSQTWCSGELGGPQYLCSFPGHLHIACCKSCTQEKRSKAPMPLSEEHWPQETLLPISTNPNQSSEGSSVLPREQYDCIVTCALSEAICPCE